MLGARCRSVIAAYRVAFATKFLKDFTMSFTTTKIKKRKFITSWSYDYQYMIIEGTKKNLDYLMQCFKDKDLLCFVDVFNDYIRIKNASILKML